MLFINSLLSILVAVKKFKRLYIQYLQFKPIIFHLLVRKSSVRIRLGEFEFFTLYYVQFAFTNAGYSPTPCRHTTCQNSGDMAKFCTSPLQNRNCSGLAPSLPLELNFLELNSIQENSIQEADLVQV